MPYSMIFTTATTVVEGERFSFYTSESIMKTIFVITMSIVTKHRQAIGTHKH